MKSPYLPLETGFLVEAVLLGVFELLCKSFAFVVGAMT